VLGAAAALNLGAVGLRTRGDDLRRATDVLGPALRRLAEDTFRGFVVWVVPGDDPYSRVQDHTSPTPGAVDARVDAFLMEGLDGLLPMPDEMLAPAVRALATGVRESPLPVELPAVPAQLAAALDDELQVALANDAAVPITLLVALLLNHLAVQVDATAVAGPFPASPFANLTHVAKSEAFRRLEEDTAAVAAAIDADLDEPSRRSVSGLLALLGSALPTFTAFGAYSEYHGFDRRTRTVSTRPIGWDLASFAPGRTRPVDGWDEVIDYHEGLR
jgi:hypothetical protein